MRIERVALAPTCAECHAVWLPATRERVELRARRTLLKEGLAEHEPRRTATYRYRGPTRFTLMNLMPE